MLDPNLCATHVLGHPLLTRVHTPTRRHIQHNQEKTILMGRPLTQCCCRPTIGSKVLRLAPNLDICRDKSTTQPNSCHVQDTNPRNMCHRIMHCWLRLLRARLWLQRDKSTRGRGENFNKREIRPGVVRGPTQPGVQRVQGRLPPAWGVKLFARQRVLVQPRKEVPLATTANPGRSVHQY